MNKLKLVKRLFSNLLSDGPAAGTGDPAADKAQRKLKKALNGGGGGAKGLKAPGGGAKKALNGGGKKALNGGGKKALNGGGKMLPRGPKTASMLLAAAVGGNAAAAGVVHETQVYKTTDRGPLSIEIYKPEGPAPAAGRPCVLFFHGGGWRRGSPRQFMAFSNLLAQRGVIGMSAQYRLLQDGDGDIAFDAVRDARSAMRWVRANAARLGCDVTRIGAGGGSAGGHLALMTAMKTRFDDPKDDLGVDPRPAALVLFNPPLNFDDYPSPVPIAQRRELAPYYLVDATLPPTILLQGTKDPTVSFKEAVAFRDKAQQIGVKDITLVPFEGRKHGFFNKGKGEPGDFDASADDMMEFLHRLGWL